MQTPIAVLITLMLLNLIAVPIALAQDAPRILFYSRSEGFEHSPVVQKEGKPCVAEKVLSDLASQNGAPFTSTKDGTKITAENLKNFDLVIFYTQGDLTKPTSKDGAPPVGPKGEADLVEWVKNGGRLMGFHSASDTFHTPPSGEVTPYLKMLGAEFSGHGPQFEGTVKVVDPMHPTMANIPKDWKLLEEWYMFKNFNKDTVHVLALLDPGPARAKVKDYNIPDYPIIWCGKFGNGKVYFSALGHRDEIWQDPIFQSSIVDAGTWLQEEGAEGTEPNFDKVVPKEKPAEKAVEKPAEKK